MAILEQYDIISPVRGELELDISVGCVDHRARGVSAASSAAVRR
jgi:hypothetical protein